MNLRWLVFDYADPILPLDRAARRRVRRRMFDLTHNDRVNEAIRPADPSVRRRRLARQLGFALIPAGVQAAIMVGYFLLDAGWRSSVIIIPILIAVQLVLTFATMSLLGRALWRPYYVLALRDEGVELCANCEYWLRNRPADSDACPECGSARLPDPARHSRRIRA